MRDLGPKRRIADSEWRMGRRPFAISHSPLAPMKPTGSPAVVLPFRRGQGKMAEDTLTTSGIGRHGATRLPSVDVDSFNIELKDDDGFLGDRSEERRVGKE